MKPFELKAESCTSKTYILQTFTDWLMTFNNRHILHPKASPFKPQKIKSDDYSNSTTIHKKYTKVLTF